MSGRLAVAGVLACAVAVACSDDQMTGPRSASSLSPALSANSNSVGAVFTQTNSAAGNEVLMFSRAAKGNLAAPVSISTGGTGVGGGLGSQGSVVLSDDGRWLFVVNAGSNNVSVFRVHKSGLTLTDVEASGGTMPISVTQHGSLVYVLNAGGVNNISGFRLSPHGDLSPIAGSSRPLSAAATGPAQVEFSPNGSQIVVTEKGTDLILTYAVLGNGSTTGPTTHASSGATPFGFAFAKQNVLIVSEAFGGAVDASAASSYTIGGGSFSVVSATVPTTETAACWTVVTKNGKFAYVTNTGSSSVTGYRVGNDGSLSILDADGVTGMTVGGGSPIDAAVSGNSHYLYVLAGGTNTITVFKVSGNGSLSVVDAAPIGGTAVGLASN